MSGDNRPRNPRIVSEQRGLFPLQFISYGHPSQSRSHKFRQTVRRHNTRLQHEKARASKIARNQKLSPGSAHSTKSSDTDEWSTDGNSTIGSRAATPSAVARSPSLQSDPTLVEKTIEETGDAVPRLAQHIAVSRVDPFTTYDPGSDWKVDVPQLIDRYLDKARSYLISQRMRKVSQALHGRLVQPQLYLNGLLFNAVFTLATTSVPAFDGQQQADPMILWLRTNFLMAIQTAVQAQPYDANALAIGIALLVAWELDVGNPRLCQLHLKALPSIVGAEPMPDGSKDNFLYREPHTDNIFRGRKEIPAGFEFYRSQNLLPASLMFHIGSLIYWDQSKPGASTWMRQLWSSIAACAPIGESAQQALAEGSMSARVAQLVRQAGIMLGSFMRSQAGELPVAQTQVSGVQAQWHSTLSNDWSSLLGTVYDEILLWCLCVFCTTSGYRDKSHLEAMSWLLSNLQVGSLKGLSALLSTYVWPECVHESLEELVIQKSSLFAAVEGTNNDSNET